MLICFEIYEYSLTVLSEILGKLNYDLLFCHLKLAPLLLDVEVSKKQFIFTILSSVFQGNVESFEITKLFAVEKIKI